jgi:hypothetical protein
MSEFISTGWHGHLPDPKVKAADEAKTAADMHIAAAHAVSQPDGTRWRSQRSVVMDGEE